MAAFSPKPAFEEVASEWTLDHFAGIRVSIDELMRVDTPRTMCTNQLGHLSTQKDRHSGTISSLSLPANALVPRRTYNDSEELPAALDESDERGFPLVRQQMPDPG